MMHAYEISEHHQKIWVPVISISSVLIILPVSFVSVDFPTIENVEEDPGFVLAKGPIALLKGSLT
jgi:hypothetical protein